MTRKKNPGSGIKKGYTYWNEMPQSSRDAISESLKDRDILWADKIKQHYADNPDKASLRDEKAWLETRHHMYEVIDPSGEIYYTTNMKKFCEKFNLTRSKMCSVAKGRAYQHKGWTCNYVFRYRGEIKGRVYYDVQS